MSAGVQRGLGTLGVLGFVGLAIGWLVAVFEVITGHGGDAVPTAWLIELGASVVSLAVGGIGWIVADVVGDWY